MSLKPGYKQTDIGVIPDDWEVKMLGDIGESLIGLTYAPADVAADGTLVLRSSNIQNDRLTFDDNVYVRSAIPQKIMVQEGDLLICVRNGSRDLIGKCAVIDDRAVGATFGAFMAVFRSRRNHFVSHQFQSHLVKKQINEHLGATINQITNRSLNSFCIPFPASTDEQVMIAEALSDVDALINSLEALLTKKRNIKTGVMQELLTGRTRLPGFSDEWNETTLGELCELYQPETISQTQMDDAATYIVYGANGPVGRYSRFNHAESEVVVACRGTCGSVNMTPPNCWITGNAMVVKPRDERSTRGYLFSALQTSVDVQATISGSAQPQITRRVLALTKVLVPSPAEQNRIVAVLSDIDDGIEALERRLAKTRDLKQGMAQELLTGRTRLV